MINTKLKVSKAGRDGKDLPHKSNKFAFHSYYKNLKLKIREELFKRRSSFNYITTKCRIL